MKILWDNWQIEWLRPIIQQEDIIGVRVHEIEENYNGFIDLLEKALTMHKIIAWIIK